MILLAHHSVHGQQMINLHFHTRACTAAPSFVALGLNYKRDSLTRFFTSIFVKLLKLCNSDKRVCLL